MAGHSDQERGWVPRRELESWLCLMHEVGVLRLPLAFGRAHADVTLSEGVAVATKTVQDLIPRAAASEAVMRSGRHFAQFTVLEGSMYFGVIRPSWDVEGGANAEGAGGHCFYHTDGGHRWPGNHNWEGKQSVQEQDDCIGMLLHLNQGSVTVWKNDEKLGVMQAEGLSGPLCWAVSMFDEGYSAHIESALAAPASLTEEELAAAKEFVQPPPVPP